jgi:hypothetical protein
MLAREGDGQPVSVVFGSFGALAAWAPSGTGNLPLPSRIAIANLAATGMPAIMDPAGPVPYRFDVDELAALADGRLPGTGEPLWADHALLDRHPGAGQRHAIARGGGGRLAARHRGRRCLPGRDRW